MGVTLHAVRKARLLSSHPAGERLDIMGGAPRQAEAAPHRPMAAAVLLLSSLPSLDGAGVGARAECPGMIPRAGLKPCRDLEPSPPLFSPQENVQEALGNRGYCCPRPELARPG